MKKPSRESVSDKLTAKFWKQDIKPGFEIGRYTLLEKLGSGKLGWAWRATSGKGDEVCLKILWTSGFTCSMDRRKYALKEYQALEILAPLGISPKPIDLYLTPWVSCVVMELIRGTSIEGYPWTISQEEKIKALEKVGPIMHMELPVWHADMHLGNFMWDGQKVWLIDLGEHLDLRDVGDVARRKRADRVDEWKWTLSRLMKARELP